MLEVQERVWTATRRERVKVMARGVLNRVSLVSLRVVKQGSIDEVPDITRPPAVGGAAADNA